MIDLRGVCIDCGHFIDILSGKPHIHGEGPKPRWIVARKGETVEQATTRHFREERIEREAEQGAGE